MEERWKIREKLEEQSIKLKETEDKLAEIWKNHHELRYSTGGGNNNGMARNAKVLETFYTLANTTNTIKAEIESTKSQSTKPKNTATNLPSLDQTLENTLKSKKLERKAKECVLNYFSENN